MANVEPPHPESPISPAISDIEDPTTPPILARLRELSRSLDEVDIISDEEASNEMLAQYKPRNARDETVRILRSFIDNLPVKDDNSNTVQGTRWKDATGHCVTLVSNRYYKR